MLSQEVKRYYRRFRQDGGGIVGENAKWALRHAKTLATFRTLESQGLVRITAEPELDNYFDVYGEPDSDAEREEIIRTLRRDGLWLVYSEYFSPESESWEHADSIGMCMGYNDPCSPFENCYVPELMREAIDRLVAETSAPERESFAVAA